MKDYSKALSEAMKLLVENAISLDTTLVSKLMPTLSKLMADNDTDAIADFFKEDKAGVKLYLEKNIMPTSFSGMRFVALLNTLSDTLDVILEAERKQIDSFLDTALTEEQKKDIYRQSLFMSPTIKQTLLSEWVNKEYKGHKLSERIWDFSKTSEQTLLKAIASGLAEGKNPKQLSPVVRKLMGDNSAYNIRRLLMTENSRVAHSVQKIALSEFKHSKYCVLKYGNRHKVDCACTPYHDKGKMKYEDAPTLPLHPLSSSYLQLVPTPVGEWKRDMGYA